MTQKITIGLIQMQCDMEPEKNLEKISKRIHECAKQGAQIIATSELPQTHYFCQGKDEKNFRFAEPIPGMTTETLSKAAKETSTVIVGSLFEKTPEGKYFNTSVVIGQDGNLIGKYHKMHIPSLPPDYYAENYYFEKGDMGFPVFQTPFGKISVPVCYDQWFPEVARISAAKGAQIIFYPTAIGWPLDNPEWKKTAEHEAWQTIQKSHSVANNVFVAPINRIGTESGLQFWGTSFVSDPYGRVLKKASTDQEENIIVECDLNIIEEMRKEWPFLDERRVKCENLT